MGKLGDIIGEDFEEKYEQERERRRELARKVPKETLMEICYEALKGGGFDGEEPRFRFDAGEIDHDVLLMESPEDNMNKFLHDLGEDAKSLGMFHLNQLFSCAFQENMLHLLEKIEPDEYYLVVGQYQEKTQTDSEGNEETYYNINPVRGIVPLEVAKKYADEYEKALEGASVEEQAQEQQAEAEEEEEEDESGVDLEGLGEDEEEVDEDRILEVFHLIGDEAPQVLEKVAEGNSDMMDKLVSVTNDNLDKEADRERILDIFEEYVESIPGRGEEEEEDEGIDLGGLGGEEEESEAEDEEDKEEEAEAVAEGSESSGGSDPSDWFS